MIGTPGFMPPEQGVGRPVFSSDLYALGLTAIYLLTGKIPQNLATDPITGDILWRQNALNIGSILANVLDQAIKNQQQQRFLTATMMKNALTKQPNFITKNTQTFIPKAQFSSSLNKTNSKINTWSKTLLAVIIVGIIIVGCGVFFYFQQQKQLEERMAELEAQSQSITNENQTRKQ